VHFPALLLSAWCTAALGEDLLTWLQSGAGWSGYGILVLAFLGGTVGLPLPEEVILATGGYLSARGALSWPLVYLLGYLVIFLLDVMLYEVGRRTGPQIEHSRFGRRLDPVRVAAAHRFFERRGVSVVVASRFLMGTRTPTFLLAGALGMPRRTFLVAVALSGILSVGIPIALGYFLADQIDGLTDLMGRLHVWSGLGVLLILVLSIWMWRRRRTPAETGQA
jgi:membrane protein DedA with SNARE-associated domain